ncbi:MAG: 5'/3'-nucleotidase SurE [Desulfobacterales bacterium]|nr:5'/3'-nucleotidase SurE [Desulfobacterales bacterium]
MAVIAPDRERTAVGHGITLHLPLRAHPVALNGGERGYAVNGTPADCVKLGILEILKHKPDLVVAGLNPGANVGVNITYSGTVAAAKEAALGGIPAIAASIDGHGPYRYDTAAAFIAPPGRDGAAAGVARRDLSQREFSECAGDGRSPVSGSAGTACEIFREYMEKRIGSPPAGPTTGRARTCRPSGRISTSTGPPCATGSSPSRRSRAT